MLPALCPRDLPPADPGGSAEGLRCASAMAPASASPGETPASGAPCPTPPQGPLRALQAPQRELVTPVQPWRWGETGLPEGVGWCIYPSLATAWAGSQGRCGQQCTPTKSQRPERVGSEPGWGVGLLCPWPLSSRIKPRHQNHMHHMRPLVGWAGGVGGFNCSQTRLLPCRGLQGTLKWQSRERKDRFSPSVKRLRE